MTDRLHDPGLWMEVSSNERRGDGPRVDGRSRGMDSGPRPGREAIRGRLAGDFDAQWGEIEPTHRAFVKRFLSRLPPDGRVLDAACGTGKYFPMVLASDRRLLGADHAGAYLANAHSKFPQVPTAKHDLQDLPCQASSTACCAWTPWNSSPRRSGRWCWSGSAGPCARGAGCT